MSTATETVRLTTAFFAEAAQRLRPWGKRLVRILTLSLADDHLMPERGVTVRLTSEEVSVIYSSRWLSRIRTRGIRRYPCEAWPYPPPEKLAATANTVIQDLKAAGERITLTVPNAWVLFKTADFPMVVKEHLSDVVSYELDRLTPLTLERAAYDFKIIAGSPDRIRILLAVVNTDILQPYLEAFRKNGMTVERVTIEDRGSTGSGDDAEGINLLARGSHVASKAPLVPTIALLAVLAVLGLFWLLSPLQIAEKKMGVIDREIAAHQQEIRKIEALQKEAKGLEQEIAVINAFGASRAVTLHLVREMTVLLPSNAWLSRLRMTESTVEIEGYAAQATEILSKLEASPHFKGAEFTAPTARDTRLNADRFIIKMEIEKGTGEISGK